MVRSPLASKRIASALLVATIAVQLHASGAWAALQNTPVFQPILGISDANAQASNTVLPQDLYNRVLASLPSNMPSTRTFGPTANPFTWRGEVNNRLRQFGLTTISENYEDSAAFRHEPTTARAICNLFGYETVTSSQAYSPDFGRSNFDSCGDDGHGIWNGSDITVVSACGGDWTSQIVCSTPFAPTPPPSGGGQCRNGIDDDGDGGIDALVTSGGGTVETRTFGTSADPGTLRNQVNQIGAQQGLTEIREAINDDPATALKVCQLLGYDSVVSTSCDSDWGDGCGFDSCGDNYLGRWNTSINDFQVLNACSAGNQWIARITCRRGARVACNDGIDNDNDGRTDFPSDSGCASATDTSEVTHDPQCTDPNDPSEFPDSQCSDGRDNDGDGLTDFPNDPGCVNAQDNDEFNAPPAQCRDGRDNDGDGRVDFPNDPGCTNPDDTNEGDDPQCSDLRDNDNDGKIDFPQDPGCTSPTDNDEFNPPPAQCQDGIDNDNDGRIDLNDPGCSGPNDTNEGGEEQCRDLRDNDGDGLTDFPADPGCTSPTDNDEFNAPPAQCRDGRDNDGDGKIDLQDPGCSGPDDNNEGDDPQCSDRRDNDNDGLTDFPNDPGCVNAQDNDEFNAPPAQCRDGRDNDGDGKIDFPQDPGCVNPDDNDEFNAPLPACRDGIDNDGDGKIDLQDPGCSGPDDTNEGDDPACSDRRDNDNDGKIDFPADPGCVNAQDNDEFNTANVTLTSVTANGCNTTVSYAKTFDACAHLLTANGQITHAQNVFCGRNGPVTIPTSTFNNLFQIGTQVKLCHPGNYTDCSATVTVTGTTQCTQPQCRDGIDNDGDGRVDLNDPGCQNPDDPNEGDDPQCSDRRDNDNDGLIDFPNDPGCVNAQDNDEFNAPLPQCRDGIDNDGDGRIDLNDPGCSGPDDTNEGDDPACSDRRDNDFDGLTDFPADPGCVNAQDNDEFNAPVTQCNDGIDNDGDGEIDYPADQGCSGLDDPNEDGAPQCAQNSTDSAFRISCTSPGQLCEPRHTMPFQVTTASPMQMHYVVGLSNDQAQGQHCSSVRVHVYVDNQLVGTSGFLGWEGEPNFGPLSTTMNLGTIQPGSHTVSLQAEGRVSGCNAGELNSWGGTLAVRASQNQCVPTPQCRDGIDNDFDGRTDFPNDPGCSGPDDTNEGDDPACSDRRDNDFDGLIDFPADPGCVNAQDNDELNAPPAQCQDGRDNDNDGLIDFPNDPGCTSPTDNDEFNAPLPACRDGIDNDGDGRIDLNDPGCSGPDDTNEGDDPQCSDRRDNDNDGLIDFPNDPGCTSPTDNDEFNAPLPACRDGIDNDGDGRIDLNDPGCSGPDDTNEGDDPQCSDRRDNDNDGLVDWPADPGCQNPQDNDEFNAPLPQCRDGIDNDGDGRIDLNDPGCQNPDDPNEGDDPACSDRRDNDNDGLIDFPLDPGCTNPQDTDETDPFVPQCSDGRDNDFDGRTDFPNDPGCVNAQDNNESDDPVQFGCIEVFKETFDPHGNPLPITAQFTFILDATRVAYNDSTGRARFDQILPGQHSVAELIPSGWTQLSITPQNGLVTVTAGTNCAGVVFKNRQVFVANAQCSDGYDNDGDGLRDFPQDPGCQSAQDNDESNTSFQPQCQDGIDNDNDGLRDFPQDPGCESSADNNEQNQQQQFAACSDGIDNDGDGATDFPQDTGCQSAQDTDEFNFRAPRCSDGVDNDQDGLTDFPQDPGCHTAADDNEWNDRTWIDRWRELWDWNW